MEDEKILIAGEDGLGVPIERYFEKFIVAQVAALQYLLLHDYGFDRIDELSEKAKPIIKGQVVIELGAEENRLQFFQCFV
jgi:hypothetical protein